MMTIPSTTSTTPVARFRVLGSALLANTAPIPPNRAHCHIGVHVQEGDEHGADDCRRAHTGKAGAKAGPHAGKKVTRTVNNTFILCVLI